MSKIQASAHSAARAPITHNSKWSVASGFCASLVCIGLARFAYTPLLPAIIDAALFQAVAAYGFSYLFSASGGDYALLFVIGTGAIALALIIDLTARSAAGLTAS